MNDNQRAEAIFDLMRRVEQGDSAAELQLRQMSERYFDLPGVHHYLLTSSCDIEDVRRCFLSSGCSFWIPDSFNLVKVDFEGGVYKFVGQDGRIQTGTRQQLVRIGWNLPWGSNRVTAKHVERAFQTCHIENDATEIPCPPLGSFKFEFDEFTCDEYSWKNRIVYISVKASTNDEFRQCVSSLIRITNRLSEFDAAARKEFATVFKFTEEDLQELRLNDLLLYIDGEFDMRYLLPEDS